MRPLIVTDTPAEPPNVDATTPAGEWIKHVRPGADLITIVNLWPKWLQLWRELSEPDVEVTVEEFGPVLALFNRLERAGVLFPRRMVAGIRRYEALALGGADDSDFDAADELLDLEDSDEDRDDPDEDNDDNEGPDSVSAGPGWPFRKKQPEPAPAPPPAAIEPPAPSVGAPASSDGVCPYGLNDPDAFAARVHGDSMAPKYQEGDILIFSPAAPVNDGDDCFVRFVSGGTTFKRVHFETREELLVVRLQPRNEKHMARVVPELEVESICKAVYRYQRTDEE